MVTVAEVNYSFFHSTQSFIYFYLSALQRVRPICITRAPESRAIPATIPPELAGDYYLYAGSRGTAVHTLLTGGGVALRRALARLPRGAARPALELLQRRVAPALRQDTDAGHYVRWAENVMRRREARLIHAYFGAVAWRMLEIKRRLGIPLVVTFIGGDDLAPSIPLWWSWWIQTGSGEPDWPARRRELLEEADLFLVEGPYMRERLIELGCPEEKLHLQRIAIPVSALPFRPRSRPNGKARIVFAGRFCEHKGVIFALEAIRALRAERHDFEFRLIGDGALTTEAAYASKVHAYIRRHRLEDCVELLGLLAHERYVEELNRGDIFLHPSVVDGAGRGEGGAPTTILEAQALGMPVVSTYHCDIPNVTRPGESALLVPERDTAALTGAIRELLDEPDRWERMGRAGRRHVEEHHDVASEAPRLEDRYLALLG